ncbi:MAG: hypothetical protein J07HQX50_00194 [Haloquadratum sp. J07HQX50]|nr:MAG: hypothetical protein J07HQX50_00194 [Haloquadratum sp. J07HQX50]
MDILFSGSVRGGQSDRIYPAFIKLLAEYGDMLTEHIAEDNIKQREAEQGLTDEITHDQDMTWSRQADIIVAGVTTPTSASATRWPQEDITHRRRLSRFE